MGTQGAVLRYTDEENKELQNNLHNAFAMHIAAIKGGSVDDAQQTATNILNGLKNQQLYSLLKTGMSKEKAIKHIEKIGIDPYLIASVKIKHDNKLHNIGYDYLQGKGYGGAIPLHAHSKYARSFPIVLRRFPSLLQINTGQTEEQNLFLVKKGTNMNENKKLNENVDLHNHDMDLDDDFDHPFHIIFDSNGNLVYDGHKELHKELNNIKNKK